jgi:hypothetical protein
MKEDAYITIGNTGEGFFRNKGIVLFLLLSCEE